ncbi:MAG: hypothetical protein K1X75_01585 [Leptospirales bacterium]|nr:hypothetical protein [Leptospirales bacterium]
MSRSSHEAVWPIAIGAAEQSAASGRVSFCDSNLALFVPSAAKNVASLEIVAALHGELNALAAACAQPPRIVLLQAAPADARSAMEFALRQARDQGYERALLFGWRMSIQSLSSPFTDPKQSCLAPYSDALSRTRLWLHYELTLVDSRSAEAWLAVAGESFVEDNGAGAAMERSLLEQASSAALQELLRGLRFALFRDAASLQNAAR